MKIPAATAARIVATGRNLESSRVVFEERMKIRKEKQESKDAAELELKQLAVQLPPSSDDVTDEQDEALHGVAIRLRRTMGEFAEADRLYKRSQILCKDLADNLVEIAIAAARAWEESGGTEAIDMPADVAETPIHDVIGPKLGTILAKECCITNFGEACKGMGRNGIIINAYSTEAIAPDVAEAISEALHSAAAAMGMSTEGMLEIKGGGVGGKKKRKTTRSEQAPDPDQLGIDAALTPQADEPAEQPWTGGAPKPMPANPMREEYTIDPERARESELAFEIAASLANIDARTPAEIIAGLSAIQHWATLDPHHDVPTNPEILDAVAEPVQGWTVETAVVALAFALAHAPAKNLELCDQLKINPIPAWLSYELLAAGCSLAAAVDDDPEGDFVVVWALERLMTLAEAEGLPIGRGYAGEYHGERCQLHPKHYPEFAFLERLVVDDVPHPENGPAPAKPAPAKPTKKRPTKKTPGKKATTKKPSKKTTKKAPASAGRKAKA